MRYEKSLEGKATNTLNLVMRAKNPTNDSLIFGYRKASLLLVLNVNGFWF